MLFTVVSHYNAAIELIVELDDNNEERRQVMILNIEAAGRAKRSGAIEVFIFIFIFPLFPSSHFGSSFFLLFLSLSPFPLSAQAAYNYLRHAQRAMPSHLMTSDYVTWFNLHHFLAESLSGAGEISEVEKLFETMLAHAREDRDRVRVYILMINARFSTGNLRYGRGEGEKGRRGERGGGERGGEGERGEVGNRGKRKYFNLFY